MTEETQLLQVTVQAEELPQYLEVNGVKYMRIGTAPDSYCADITAARLYFREQFGDAWSGQTVRDCLSAWLELRKYT
jgi:hypothetical protein